MKQNVLIFQPTIFDIGLRMLEEHFNLITCPRKDEETIINYINEHHIQAVVTRTEHITEKILSSCSNLKLVAQHGVGVDNIDVNAATKNGVMVTNVPDSNFSSVAEHAMMMMLALSRNILQTDQEVRKGNWDYREQFIPTEIGGKKLLIVGLGTIGQELARKANAFNMEVISFDPIVSQESMNVFGVTKVNSLEEGLKQADFVSLHVPLNKHTHHLINEKSLKLMKQTAYLINLSRGPVVDELALYDALKNKVIQGAALDVMEEEPPKTNHPLFELDNIILTPHTAGDTVEAKIRTAIFLAENVISGLSGQLPKNLYNIDVLKNR